MNKHFKYLIGAIAICSIGFTSCSDDDPDSNTVVQISLEDCNIVYNNDQVWQGWDQPGELVLRGFTFSHNVGDYGNYSGFVAATIADNEKPASGVWYDNATQFEVITKGGSFGIGSPYLVGYWDNYTESTNEGVENRTCLISYSGVDASREFYPMYVKVTNTAYTYYAMLEGDNFAKKFEAGDWLKLTAHGVTADGTETSTDFMLADMDTKGIVNDWQIFDLTPLGKVKYVYFTMSSSDNSEYGMNTPSYFALDQFTAEMINY